jgi:hypothetical protein
LGMATQALGPLNQAVMQPIGQGSGRIPAHWALQGWHRQATGYPEWPRPDVRRTS